MSYMRQVRRRAHEVATLPRRGWHRVYSYRDYRSDGFVTRGLVFRTPVSHDAPYGDQDAHFWDWTAAVLILAVMVGLAVWGIGTLA